MSSQYRNAATPLSIPAGPAPESWLDIKDARQAMDRRCDGGFPVKPGHALDVLVL